MQLTAEENRGKYWLCFWWWLLILIENLMGDDYEPVEGNKQQKYEHVL